MLKIINDSATRPWKARNVMGLARVLAPWDESPVPRCYRAHMVQRASAAAVPVPKAKRPRYEAPPRIEEISTSGLGFTNGALLEFPTLFVAGDQGLFKRDAVAIVGSRGASREGCERAAALARELVREGVVVMSGLAAGIDASAHMAAIQAGGATIAVVGTGLDKVYPSEHASLQEQIYREHLLVSPFAVGGRFFPSFFPRRNKLMAKLARATVVIEAGDTSGTLHQVVASLEYSRPVFISKAVVDDPRLKWPKRFIGKPNVYELESVSDVCDIILR
jgi:DNA processing protein